MLITPIDIFLMDIGTPGYTEFDTNSKEFVEYLMKKQYFDYNQGKIHSHNTMRVFHSATDMKDLEEHSDKFNFYLSLIVNNFMDLEAKVSFVGKVNTKPLPFVAVDEKGNSYNLSERSELEYEELFIYDCNIKAPIVKIEAEDDFIESDGFSAKLIGLTATPGRSYSPLGLSEEDRKLSSFYNNNKISMIVPGYLSPIDYLVENGYLAKANFKPLNYYHPGISAFELKDSGGSETMKALSNNVERNKKIINRLRHIKVYMKL